MTRPPVIPLLRPRAIIAVAAVLVMFARCAAAETADKDKPINWIADSADVNSETKVGTLVGNVVITQGTTVIHADKITFHQNPDNSMSATAYGNPITFRQKRDAVDEYYEGFAQRAEYDGTKQLLELFDKGLLRRGQDEIRSNYISYNTATDFARAEGRGGKGAADPGSTGARVRGVFQPKSGTALPGKGKDAAKSSEKDAPKSSQKDAAKTPEKDAAKAPAKSGTPDTVVVNPPPATLKPATEISPQPVK